MRATPMGLDAVRKSFRAPAGLLGMVVLVVLAERSVMHSKSEFMSFEEEGYVRARQVASRGVTRVRVLCFGDSLIKQGVVPAAVEERSGRPTYNLALPGSTAPSSYFLLRRALRSGARPDAVLLTYSPNCLKQGPRQTRGWSFLLSLTEAAQLALWGRDPVFFAELLVHQLPSVRLREGVRARLLARLQDVYDRRSGANLVLGRNWEHNQGAWLVPAPKTLKDTTDAGVEVFEQRMSSDWACDPVNARAVEALLDLAASHGVPVYWVRTPYWPALQDRMERSGFDGRTTDLLRSWQERHPNLTVLDARRAVDDPTGYTDLIHMSLEGAYSLSLGLGDFLSRASPAPGASASSTPRRVELPPCRPTAQPPGVEDFDQSRLAIDRIFQGRLAIDRGSGKRS